MTTQAWQISPEDQATADRMADEVQRDWKEVADRQREEIAALKRERRALCDVLSNDSSTIAGQTLVEAMRAICRERDEARAAADQAISNLRAIVSLNDDPHIDEMCRVTADVLGVTIRSACARCGRELNNVSPGISVVAGGVSVCASCLRAGEREVARARSIS